MDETKGVTQFVVIVDFSNLGYSNFDLEGTKVMVEVLEAYFPERLGVSVCINTGWLFWILWKLISPFIPKRTREKVVAERERRVKYPRGDVISASQRW